MPVKPIHYLPAMLIALCLSACAAPIIGATSDERSFGEHIDDSSLEASIKKAIVSEQASKILDVNVYSFYGDVYLIGEADQEHADKAVQATRNVEGVRSITTYFFPPGTMTAQDLLTEAKINQSLLFTSGIPSGQVQVDVWAGQAVLLGILSTQEQMNQVLEAVQDVSGVKRVKNYLRLKADIVQ